MKFFIESQNVDMWEIVQEGPYIPTKRNLEGIMQDKPKAKWSLDEKQIYFLNTRAKYFLLCALNKSEFDKVVGMR